MNILKSENLEVVLHIPKQIKTRNGYHYITSKIDYQSQELFLIQKRGEKMKFCPNCGAKNKDEAKFCVDCGYELQDISSSQPKADAQTPQYNGQKNKWIAPILNFIGGMILYGLCGIGHAIYLRLFNRAAIFGAIGFLLSAIFTVISIFYDTYAITILITAIGIGITVYATYDGYRCSQAINEGRELPTIFGGFRPESISKGKAAGIAVIALVILIISFVAFASTATLDDASPTGLADDVIIEDASGSTGDGSVQIKITYPGEWSATVGDESTSISYSGTGNDAIKIDESKYEVIAAAVQKMDGSSDKLKVQIIKDGDVLDSKSTSEKYGLVSVGAII